MKFGKEDLGHDVCVQKLKSNHYGFRFELRTAGFVDALLDEVFQGEDFYGGSSAKIDHGKCVLTGDSHAAQGEPAMKSGVFDQPRGRDSFLLSKAGELGNVQP